MVATAAHEYSFDELGLDAAAERARFAPYTRHFCVPDEVRDTAADPTMPPLDGCGSPHPHPRDQVPPEAFTLVEAVRDLVEATVMTDVAASRARGGRRARRRPRPSGSRPPSGRPGVARQHTAASIRAPHAGRHRTAESAGAAGGVADPGRRGRTSSRRPIPRPVRCWPGARSRRSARRPARARARRGRSPPCSITSSGFATAAVGKSGMTAGLDIRYKGATPYGVPLMVTCALHAFRGTQALRHRRDRRRWRRDRVSLRRLHQPPALGRVSVVMRATRGH